MNEVKKAYDVYKKIVNTDYANVTTERLNALYNIECRIKRDEKYRLALEDFQTEEGEHIADLIEKYFVEYNAKYGLEIRDSLTELSDLDAISGGYFLIETYKKDGKTLIPTEPTEFSVGDRGLAKVKLFSKLDCEPMEASHIKYTVKTDDGDNYAGELQDTDTVKLEFRLYRPGWVYFRVEVVDGEGKAVPGFDIAYGGVLFDIWNIPLAKESPKDLYSFWDRQIDRLMKISPTDTVSDGYSGFVKYEYDMPKENSFKLVKLDSEYLKMLGEYGIGGISEPDLSKCDFYEVNLKAPGPCHSSNYLSIPKGASPKSLPIMVTFDGYSAYPMTPSYSSSYINIHCSHHGYSLPKPLNGYYDKLRSGVCKHYGLGNGDPNSMYEDLEDNYMLYLHLRNLQAIRFITDSALSSMIENLHEFWNGEIKLEGGSMGGYQTVCTAALSGILVKKSAPYKLVSTWINVPAFCNLAGREDGRIPSMTYYTDGMEYFDAAHLAAFVNVKIFINRVGLGDTTCGVNGIMSMFNNIPDGVEKEINFLQNSDHGTLPPPARQKWVRYKFN